MRILLIPELTRFGDAALWDLPSSEIAHQILPTTLPLCFGSIVPRALPTMGPICLSGAAFQSLLDSETLLPEAIHLGDSIEFTNLIEF